MSTLIRSICDCGTQKTDEHGYMICDHCDTPCGIKNCGLCRMYATAISRRLNLT